MDGYGLVDGSGLLCSQPDHQHIPAQQHGDCDWLVGQRCCLGPTGNGHHVHPIARFQDAADGGRWCNWQADDPISGRHFETGAKHRRILCRCDLAGIQKLTFEDGNGDDLADRLVKCLEHFMAERRGVDLPKTDV